MIAIFDIGGPPAGLQPAPLERVQYRWPRWCSAACFPVAGMIIGFVGHRRVDAVGALVLAGIVVGAILGLVSGNPKLVLDEGSVCTPACSG